MGMGLVRVTARAAVTGCEATVSRSGNAGEDEVTRENGVLERRRGKSEDVPRRW